MKLTNLVLVTSSLGILSSCSLLTPDTTPVVLQLKDCGFYEEYPVQCKKSVIAEINAAYAVANPENPKTIKCSDIILSRTVESNATNNINYQKICLGRTNEQLVPPTPYPNNE